MTDISSSALSPVLSALGEQLASKGGEIHLVVIGGSGLLAMGLGDRPTQDVDVVAIVQDGKVDQIDLKLYAFADRREPRDEADLRRLEPTGEELTAAATWARTHNAPGPFDDALARALRAFGVTDAGRDV